MVSPMKKTLSFYVIKLENDMFYRRNHESVGGIRPTSSVIYAEQYATFESAKLKYDMLLQNEYNPKPIGIARFGLLNGELLK